MYQMSIMEGVAHLNNKRLELHRLLCQVLDPTGIKNNVYYQPPQSVSMKYPAIVYRRSKIQNRHADDIIYSTKTAYEVTVIDYDPDSPMLERMFSLRYCDHDRHYAMDGLNHDVFTLYY